MRASTWRASTLAAVVALAACKPAPYSEDVAGFVLGPQGKPVAGAYVGTFAYQVCGSVGGKTTHLLKTSVTHADAEGRFKDHVSGIEMSWGAILVGCGGYEYRLLVCKAGYSARTIQEPNQHELVYLDAGNAETYLPMPPECQSDRVLRPRSLPQLPPPPRIGRVKSSVELGFWNSTSGVHVDYEDPPGRVAVTFKPFCDRYFLNVSESILSGRPHYASQIMRSNNILGYGAGCRAQEKRTSYWFVLGAAEAHAKPLTQNLSKAPLQLEPIGGLRWTADCIDPAGRKPIEPKMATREDWSRLRPEIVKIAEKEARRAILIYDPPGLPLGKPEAKKSGRYGVELAHATRTTMPLWADKEWMYPEILDPSGKDSPFPAMPAVTLDGFHPRLVIEEAVSGGKTTVSARLIENKFFYTTDYGGKDGRFTSYIFELGSPPLEAAPLIHLTAERTRPRFAGDSIRKFAPGGGVRWTIDVSGGVRKSGPLRLETVERADWRRFREAIVSLNHELNAGMYSRPTVFYDERQ